MQKSKNCGTDTEASEVFYMKRLCIHRKSIDKSESFGYTDFRNIFHGSPGIVTWIQRRNPRLYPWEARLRRNVKWNLRVAKHKQTCWQHLPVNLRRETNIPIMHPALRRMDMSRSRLFLRKPPTTKRSMQKFGSSSCTTAAFPPPPKI